MTTYFKSVSLGHEFKSESLTTTTNFFFTLHVAMEGPSKGLLLFGEAQETATVFKKEGDRAVPQAVLQRQFSIRLK